MAACITEPSFATESHSFPYAAWKASISRLREFAPDIIVLVARKMPRLAEYFGFNLGSNCIVISDLAIPFAHKLIAGARVAVLDDVVNVGSTIKRAVRSIQACGAALVKTFALGSRSQECCRSNDIECVWDVSFSPDRYREWTETVPAIIRKLPKPYDIEFPIIPCRLNPPYTTAYHVQEWLIKRFGRERFHSSPLSGDCSGPARFSVDVPFGRTGHTKIRFYLNNDQSCNLVPFAIPAILDGSDTYRPIHTTCMNLLSEGLRRLRDAPPEASLWSEEPYVRLAMFVRSLDFGLQYLDELSDLLSVVSDPPVSLIDAALLLGPLTRAQLVSNIKCSSSLAGIPNEKELPASRTPFLDFLKSSERGAGFLERVTKAVGSGAGFTLFSVVFNELACVVGASDSSAYSLEWPYSKREILEEPYLRLRIGLTFEDIVSLYQAVLDSDHQTTDVQLRANVSALLDHAIDEGAVVPTLARYGEHFYRVFRKGETDPRDRAIDRVLYAWESSKRPMSLTRFTKINAILSFAEEIPQIFSPDLFTRGNVAVIEPGVLDLEPAEIARYLLKSGRLKKAN